VAGADRRTAELTAAREGLAEIEGLIAAGQAEYEGSRSSSWSFDLPTGECLTSRGNEVRAKKLD